jgi:trk system potassium uptake protein
MLRRILDLPLIVILMGVMGAAMFLPAIHAAATDDEETARAFFYAAITVLLLVGVIAIATSNRRPSSIARNQLLTLVGAYAVLPVIATVPLLQAVPDTSLGNAWFEMVSCFTTTGATVYDSAGRLPPSAHLWRATVGWLGGFFVLLAAIAILAPMNLGGAELHTAAATGRGASGTRQVTHVAEAPQRTLRYTVLLFPAYFGLTMVLWIGLMMSGEAPLLSLILSMGTLSTSGITDGQGRFVSTGGFGAELLVFAFLTVAVTRRALPGLALVDRTGRILADPEVRMAGFVVISVAAALFLRHWIATLDHPEQMSVVGALRTLWAALFTTLSFLTTTGYAPQDWDMTQIWLGYGSPGLVLVGLAIVGGGVATTAGGVKLLRVYALFRHGEHELERLVHPNSVAGKGEAARRLRQDGAVRAWIFFMLFAITIIAAMMALSLVGVAFDAAMVLAVSALTTTGPLAGIAGAKPILYSALDGSAQAILAVSMVVGRLETLAILALFAPDGWQR